jgi:hypothetical protein
MCISSYCLLYANFQHNIYPLCNLQSRARTHAVLVIGLFELFMLYLVGFVLYLIFNFLYSVLWIIACPFVLFSFGYCIILRFVLHNRSIRTLYLIQCSYWLFSSKTKLESLMTIRSEGWVSWTLLHYYFTFNIYKHRSLQRQNHTSPDFEQE